MTIEQISDAAKQLKKKYDETEPERLAEQMKILVSREPMGLFEGCCKGFFLVHRRKKHITINGDLPDVLQKVVLAHELGHCILHSGSSGAAFQERPQPAVISRGTGIILPGRPCALAYCSICIACVVPANVRIQVSFRCLISFLPFSGFFCIPDAGCRLSHCCISSSANSRKACAAIRTSSSVSTWEKLNRTAPCSRVPSASCISGAQCAPLRTAIP